MIVNNWLQKEQTRPHEINAYATRDTTDQEGRTVSRCDNQRSNLRSTFHAWGAELAPVGILGQVPNDLRGVATPPCNVLKG